MTSILTSPTSSQAPPQPASREPSKAPPKVVRPGEGECVEAFGDRAWFLLCAEDTDHQFVLMQNETPAGSGPPLHVHDEEDQLWIIQRGRYEFEMGHERQEAGPGAAVFGPRGVPQTFFVVGDEPGQMLTLSVPGGFESFFKRSAREFATGAPDIHKIVRLGLEHHIAFLTTESAAYEMEHAARETQPARFVSPNDGETIGAHGHRARLVLRAEETGGQFSLVELQTPPGQGAMLHAHTQEDELFIIQSGRYEFQLGTETFEAGPGTIVYGARPVPHAFRVVSEEPGRMWLWFRPGGFEKYLRELVTAFAHSAVDLGKIAEIGARHGLVYPQG